MVLTVATVLLLALTRAEIIERMRAPVITQADGLVKVYADCSEDQRREFQSPIASFAAETVKLLYRGLARKPVRFARAGIAIHVGNVRTNVTDVTCSVSTNGNQVVSRIRIPSPGYADLGRLRTEIVKAFYRSVTTNELSDAEAVLAYRRADPRFRVADERQKLEDWLAGRGNLDDEEGLRLMRRVFEPGRANRRDVLIFASRLYLYPPQRDALLLGKYECLSFAEVLRLGRSDPLVRMLAMVKSYDLPVLGGGRSAELTAAAQAYCDFLQAFAQDEKDVRELRDLLDDADTKLNIAFEKAEQP